MISVPLFGKDSIPHRTSVFFGLIGTAFLWIIFLLCMIFVPVRKKQNLKPVRIVLDSTPLEKKVVPEENASTSPDSSENQITDKVEQSQESFTEQQSVEEIVEQPVSVEETIPEPAAEPMPVAAETPVVTKPVTEPAKPAAKKVEKTAPVEKKEAPKEIVKETAPAVEEIDYFENYSYSVDPETAFANQLNKLSTDKKNDEWKEDMFSDASDISQETSNNIQKKVATQSSFEGAAGSVEQTKTQTKTTTTATETKTASENNKASADTQNVLSGVKNAQQSNSKEEGSKEGSKQGPQINNGSGISMKWNSGSARSLREPAVPVVELSKESGEKISNDVTVKIEFEVLDSGNVGIISIKPEALLPESVRNEIKAQISKWRFDPSSQSDTASFDYTIKKK